MLKSEIDFAELPAEAPPAIRRLLRRKAWPALVNPVVQSPRQQVLSLRGEWEFVTREVAPSRLPAQS